MPRGGTVVLSGGAAPLGSPCGFRLRRGQCARISRRHVNDRSHHHRLGQAQRRPGAAARATACGRISPVNGDALLYFASALFALVTIYTSTNGLYEVWGRMALAPFAFGAVASAGLALFLYRARRRQPAHRAERGPAPPGLGGADHRRRLRVRRRPRHPAGPRGHVALRRGGRLAPATRGDDGRGRRAGPRQGPGPVPQDRQPRTTRWRTTRRASRTRRASCRTCRSWRCSGIPSDIWPNNGLSDARIFFCVTTLAVAAVALYSVPGGRAPQDPRPPGPDHPAPRLAAAGDRGRRHPGRRLPAPGHGAGAAAATVRLGHRAAASRRP